MLYLNTFRSILKQLLQKSVKYLSKSKYYHKLSPSKRFWHVSLSIFKVLRLRKQFILTIFHSIDFSNPLWKMWQYIAKNESLIPIKNLHKYDLHKYTISTIECKDAAIKDTSNNTDKESKNVEHNPEKFMLFI